MYEEEKKSCEYQGKECFWVVYRTEAVSGGNPAGEARKTVSVVCPNCGKVKYV